MRQAEHRNAIRSTAALLAEAAALFAVLAVPYFLPDLDAGRSASRFIAVAYLLWSFVAAVRGLPGGRPSWSTVSLVGSTQLVCGAMMSLMFWPWLIGGVAYWAFLPLMARPTGTASADLTTPIVIALVPPAIFGLGLLAARLRPDDGPGDLRRWRLPREPSGSLLTLAAILILGAGLFGVWAVGSDAIRIDDMVSRMTPHRTTPLAWELAVASPGIPVALLAASVLLVMHRRMLPAILAICDARPRDHARLRRGLSGLGVAALGCGVVVFGGIAHAFHAPLAYGFALRDEAEPVTWVTVALYDWVAEQRAEGRSAADIAAVLEADGQRTPEAPDAGLAALLSGIEVEEVGSGLQESACRYSVAADVADVAALQGVSWMTQEQASLDVRYCLVISCPPAPAPWESEPIVLMSSSHPSRNRYWAGNLQLDIFAGDAEPGGYCTAAGTLAEHFQG